MQNITAPISESESTYKSYASFDGFQNYRYIFYLPIYSNMPNSTSLPNPGNPNNWLSKLTVNGATVSGFDSAKTNYSINVLSQTSYVDVDYVKVANSSTVTGSGRINLTGNQTVVNVDVTAGNGDKRTYTLTINKQQGDSNVAVSEVVNQSGIRSDGTYLSGIGIGTTTDTLRQKFTNVTGGVSVSIKNANGAEKNGILATGDKVVISTGSDTKEYYVVIYGDINGDGLIKASDYVLIKNSIMGTKYLSGANLKAADVNKDGNVKANDYVLIKNNIMGTFNIVQ